MGVADGPVRIIRGSSEFGKLRSGGVSGVIFASIVTNLLRLSNSRSGLLLLISTLEGVS
jgi:hypothetical protein